MCVHAEPESLILFLALLARARAREHTCTSHTDAEEIRRMRRGTERERGRSDYRARASGCPRRVRPHTDRPSSLPRTILPVSPFLEHGPRGITVGFQRVGTLVSRNVNAAPSSCRDALKVGPSLGPATSGGFKDLCHFYIKRVLIPLKRPMRFAISEAAIRRSRHP